MAPMGARTAAAFRADRRRDLRARAQRRPGQAINRRGWWSTRGCAGALRVSTALSSAFRPRPRNCTSSSRTTSTTRCCFAKHCGLALRTTMRSFAAGSSRSSSSCSTIPSRIPIHPEALRTYYDAHPDQFSSAERVSFTHAFFSADREAMRGRWHAPREAMRRGWPAAMYRRATPSRSRPSTRPWARRGRPGLWWRGLRDGGICLDHPRMVRAVALGLRLAPGRVTATSPRRSCPSNRYFPKFGLPGCTTPRRTAPAARRPALPLRR